MTGSLLRPLAWPLLRGTASRDGDWITFKAHGVDSTKIDLPSRVGLELARVRTPDEATKFVGRHGPLLTNGELFVLEDKIHGVTMFGEPIVLRSRVQEVLIHARRLSEIITVALLARQAAAGDRDAAERLARHATPQKLSQALVIGLTEEGAVHLPPRSDPEQWMTTFLADALEQALAGVRVHLQPSAPGYLVQTLLCENLLDSCYLSVALALSAKEPLGTCRECARVFVVEDARQKFCEPSCGNRARVRRFKQRRQGVTIPGDESVTRNKTRDKTRDKRVTASRRGTRGVR